MSCYHPVMLDIGLVPCGRCSGCRLQYSQMWAIRCVHEAQLRAANSFITLTFRDDPGSLDYSHWKLFHRRLNRVADCNVRFFMCGEYGSKQNRAHYHALLFGYDFLDKKYYRKSPAGAKVYKSVLLDSIWKMGNCFVGDVNFKSAAYCARYLMKKFNHHDKDLVAARYTDRDTGEIRCPEFCGMSLKPGIGADWFNKYRDQVFPRDYVVIDGRKFKPPRYYSKLAESDNSLFFQPVKERRLEEFKAFEGDTTRSRLDAREICTEAMLRSLKREIE